MRFLNSHTTNESYKKYIFISLDGEKKYHRINCMKSRFSMDNANKLHTLIDLTEARSKSRGFRLKIKIQQQYQEQSTKISLLPYDVAGSSTL